jgi:hypothetical protein
MAESHSGKTATCPICKKPVEPRYRPFCSQRCQQRDLGQWLNENYRIAADSDPNAPGTLPQDDLDE